MNRSLKRSFRAVAFLGLVILTSCKLEDFRQAQEEDPNLDFRMNVIALVDQARNQNTICAGTIMPTVKRLAESEPMNQAAEAHSYDMKQRRYVSRISPTGETVGSRLVQQGVNPCAVGDMVLKMDRAKPSDVVRYWLTQRESCMKIMDPDFDHLGFGKAESLYTLYLAQTECHRAN